FSAPSGTGKTTLVQWLLKQGLNLGFSVSATSRPPRNTEVDGKDYFFLTPADFRQKIEANAFLEWEEVYTDKFYGTLRSEVERMMADGRNVLLDIDVKGGLNIKQQYGSKALAVFIKPPSIDVLRQRLENRGTDSADVIRERLEKASFELSFAPKFDAVIVNDDLETAKQNCLEEVRSFISAGPND
ncbi:MAG: guanylate kinase, partial [Bacteroidota bacterium]|nr:guanylate kinase [Bacteroidota bacterium]